MRLSSVKLKQMLRISIIFIGICVASALMYFDAVPYEDLRYTLSTFNFFTSLFFVLNAIAWVIALLITYQPLIELREYIKIRKRDKYRSYVISQYVFSILVLLAINIGLDILFARQFFVDSVLISLVGSFITIVLLHISKFQSKVFFAILIGIMILILI